MDQYDSASDYYETKREWSDILLPIRDIMLGAGLDETLKWSIPAYIDEGKNIIGVAAFKNFVGIWFHHGVFLKDPAKVLINAQPEKTTGMRQWRFSNVSELNLKRIRDYVEEAIENSRNGLTIKPKRKTPFVIPVELQHVLKKNKELNDAYARLSMSKQRDYAEYIESAKRDQTKQSRLGKIIPMIQQGIGLNDKYQKKR